jgi:hypothetical protein
MVEQLVLFINVLCIIIYKYKIKNMFFNKKKNNKKEDNSHLNFMGGKSYDITDPILKLRISLSSCFFGEPMYYHRDDKTKINKKSKNLGIFISDSEVKYLRDSLNAIDPQEWRAFTPAEIVEDTINKALDFDPEKTLQEAVRLRNEANIRITPQIILVIASNHEKVRGTGLIRKYAKQIIKRADEPAHGLAYQLFKYENKPIPNSLKKAWKEALERFDEYQLGKYRLEDKEVKTVDVINLVHPKSEAVSKLVKGELSNTGKTWEAIISEKGSKKETWSESIQIMGHMALLRNIRNFIKNEVSPKEYLDLLLSGVEKGKQLPFRYYSAYTSVKDQASPKILDCIETCLEKSLKNLPYFEGKTMSLCDNSGSAQGTSTSSMGSVKISTIGNLSGIITGKITDEGYLGIFGDKLEILPIKKKSSTFDLLEQADNLSKNIGQATENGIWLFWEKAIKEKQHWDNVFIYSDMQAGHGRLYGLNKNHYKEYVWMNSQYIDVPKLIKNYRELVNPNVKVFLVQIAGYKDTIMPEFYDKTYILGGWGEGLFRFAHQISKIT